MTINGTRVQDVDQSTVPAIKDKPLTGYVSLQNHGGRIEFRNLQLQELDAAQASTGHGDPTPPRKAAPLVVGAGTSRSDRTIAVHTG